MSEKASHVLWDATAMLPDAARTQAKELLKVQVDAVTSSVGAWGHVSPNWISETWREQIPVLATRMSALQVEAATVTATTNPAVLGQMGSWVPPTGFVNVNTFGGFAADGRGLDGLLYSPAVHTKHMLNRGLSVDAALNAGGERLSLIVKTLISDAGRQASGVMVAARPGTGYVRMTSPPSCPDCIILAGRFYRWNTGFLRHPGCDCVHVPARSNSTAGAISEGYVDDPYKLFEGLSEADQDLMFGKANAQAIREGADIFQVVNSKRGLSRTGLFTTSGTTRGHAAGLMKPGQRRATPELIYQWSGGSSREARRLLVEHGYILPGGQNPAGVLRGQVEGFGALGGGGARRAASQAVLEARRTGVRDPNNRYTMTAAERRLYDAERAWSMVLEGRNPYSSPGFGNIPDPYGLRINTRGGAQTPLTPQVAAQVESHYMRMIATNGAYFTR